MGSTAESPAVSHKATLEVEGCQLSFVIRGSGPPVVLIQGVGVHGSGWDPQVEFLSQKYTCLTFDNRGIGNSQPSGAPLAIDRMARDTVALMDHLGWASAHVVGHSMGGPIALQLALEFPQRVKSLSLLCTSANGADLTKLSLEMLWLGMRTRIGSRRMRRLAFLEIVMPDTYLKAVDRDQVAKDLARLFGHDLGDTPAIVMKQLRALRSFNATDRLHELGAIPTLVVSAPHDRIAKPASGKALAGGVPGALYVEIPDAAHGVTIQRAPDINALLDQHFSKATLR